MKQVSQYSKKKKFLNNRFWSGQFLIRDRLGIFALILFTVGLVFLVIPVDTLRGIGGILFGTGLTVVITTWNNREQSAKDANLRRKKEIYGHYMQNYKICGIDFSKVLRMISYFLSFGIIFEES